MKKKSFGSFFIYLFYYIAFQETGLDLLKIHSSLPFGLIWYYSGLQNGLKLSTKAKSLLRNYTAITALVGQWIVARQPTPGSTRSQPRDDAAITALVRQWIVARQPTPGSTRSQPGDDAAITALVGQWSNRTVMSRST